MKKMFLLFSHQLTPLQEDDARENWDVEDFIHLPDNLQKIWSRIDPDEENIDHLIEPVQYFLEEKGEKDDIVLIQGDFGASCMMVERTKRLGMIPVYATTVRVVEEYEKDGQKIKKSIFEHRRFRKYA